MLLFLNSFANQTWDIVIFHVPLASPPQRPIISSNINVRMNLIKYHFGFYCTWACSSNNKVHNYSNLWEIGSNHFTCTTHTHEIDLVLFSSTSEISLCLSLRKSEKELFGKNKYYFYYIIHYYKNLKRKRKKKN